MFKAVIFDMDGVLIDSEPLHNKAMINALKKYDLEISNEYSNKFIGSTIEHMLDTIIKDFDLTVTSLQLMELYMNEKNELVQKEGYSPIPYTKELIKDLYLHNIKLAIASSSTEKEIMEVVESLNIASYFDHFVSGTKVPNPKPAPDVFLKAVESLGVSPKECMIIEDSYNGVCAANLAGIPVIGFINENSGNQDLSQACNLIDSFKNVNFGYISKLFDEIK